MLAICCNQREVDLRYLMRDGCALPPPPPCATTTEPSQSGTRIDPREVMQELPDLLVRIIPASKSNQKLILTRIDIYLFRKGKTSWSSQRLPQPGCSPIPPQGCPQRNAGGARASLILQVPYHRGVTTKPKVQDFNLDEHKEELEMNSQTALPKDHSKKTKLNTQLDTSIDKTLLVLFLSSLKGDHDFPSKNTRLYNNILSNWDPTLHSFSCLCMLHSSYHLYFL